MPQWKKTVCIASCMAALVSGSALGGAMKSLMGSATLQNTKPMPIPPPNSCANHEKFENSGSSSSWPSFMLPYLLSPMATA